MNASQKRVLLTSLIIFIMSIAYIPEQSTYNNHTYHEGWGWIWNLSEEIGLKVLIIEWIGIAVTGLALFLYFKSPNSNG